MTDRKVCDIKDCNDEATDIIDCEDIQDYFSVYMCSKHFQYFVSDRSLGRPIDLKPIDGQVHQLLHYSGGLLTKIANLKLSKLC
ncbi:MAG TPA: hypothetical protein VIX38_03745 [Nitrososphaeraceae archaeon]